MLTALVSSVVVLIVASSALAHGAYTREWLGSSINWRFTAGFPIGGGQRDSVVEGTDQWTNAPNATFTWNEIGQVPNWTISFNCGATWAGGNGNNTVNWKSIDGGGFNILGDALVCPTSGTGFITKFWIRFDSDNAADFHWPGHTPDDPPDGKLDGWALAAHEFGHATGFQGHVLGSGNYCDGELDDHTMCPELLPGLARQRTLEVHDVDTFQSVY